MKITVTEISSCQRNDGEDIFFVTLVTQVEGAKSASQALAVALQAAGTKAAVAEPKPAEAAPEPKSEPAARKRGRPKKAEAVEEEKPAEEAAEEAPRKRRRPDRKPEAEAREISDADLASAASHAARKVTPAKVIEKLEEFGVSEIRQLEGDQRAEFVDWSNALESE